MRNKMMCLFSLLIVAICVYGPNVPSGGYAYAPEIPEKVKKLREKA